MFQPSNPGKFRKPCKLRKGLIDHMTDSDAFLDKGDFGLKATTPGRITPNQLEAIRKTLVRELGKKCKLFIRVFPHRTITKKPAEVRMGSGKGSPDGFIARVAPGRILFEVEGVTEEKAREAFQQASYKLPIRTVFIKRDI